MEWELPPSLTSFSKGSSHLICAFIEKNGQKFLNPFLFCVLHLSFSIFFHLFNGILGYPFYFAFSATDLSMYLLCSIKEYTM